MLNEVYKERFPKATAQMEEKLANFIQDLEQVRTEIQSPNCVQYGRITGSMKITFSSSPCKSFYVCTGSDISVNVTVRTFRVKSIILVSSTSGKWPVAGVGLGLGLMGLGLTRVRAGLGLGLELELRLGLGLGLGLRLELG